MRSIITKAILLLLTSVIARAQEFRGIPWGGSQAEIIKEEGKPDHLENVSGLKALVYENENLTFLNQTSAQVAIIYILVDDKLVRAKYIFNEYVSENDSYIVYMGYFEQAMEANYGEPTEVIDDWADSEERYFRVPQKSSWGHELAMGRVEFNRKYEDEHLEASLALWNDDRTIRLELNYTSKKYGHIEDKSILNRVKRDF